MKEILAALSNGEDEACLHLAFLKNNRCAVCKKSVDYNIPATFLFRYISPDLYLTVDAIRRLRDLDLDKLLLRKKLRLVLDLDNTLVHGGFSVKLRPGVLDFLKKATELFDLTMYTMSKDNYAKEIAKILESGLFRFSRVIAQAEFTKKGTKSLEFVLSHQQVTLIVDDLADNWATADQRNVIKIKRYEFFKDDGEAPPSNYHDDDQDLDRVWSILKNVHTRFFDQNNQNNVARRDVRQLLRIN
ncbi:RNA polymerase II C-terminal domain phosphatase-like 4 [Silene latifolia]|uniref:RNA polymerase II C-terminal domain phosphatase-like 4 n=1 Tax=Silene latifolia TaxID=37657 RepID=UPI003D76FB00